MILDPSNLKDGIAPEYIQNKHAELLKQLFLIQSLICTSPTAVQLELSSLGSHVP